MAINIRVSLRLTSILVIRTREDEARVEFQNCSDVRAEVVARKRFERTHAQAADERKGREVKIGIFRNGSPPCIPKAFRLIMGMQKQDPTFFGKTQIAKQALIAGIGRLHSSHQYSSAKQHPMVPIRSRSCCLSQPYSNSKLQGHLIQWQGQPLLTVLVARYDCCKPGTGNSLSHFGVVVECGRSSTAAPALYRRSCQRFNKAGIYRLNLMQAPNATACHCMSSTVPSLVAGRQGWESD